MKLYSYYRSSAAYRVRIALELKGLGYELEAVNLLQQEQHAADYLALNGQGLVPALVTDQGDVIAQSMAILEWLEETYPARPLYSSDPLQRTAQRAFCQHIACDIHPLNNISILDYLRDELALTAEQRAAWYSRWVQRGFTALERVVAAWESDFSLGDQPGMVEVTLVPQVFNARRFDVDIGGFPALLALDARCRELPAFTAAHPDRQPDSPAL